MSGFGIGSSRRTARIVGEAYREKFSIYRDSSYRGATHTVLGDALYDFLFDRDYLPWFCNAAKHLYPPRAIQEYVMQLHTGETQAKATPNWDWDQRRKLGQRYLEDLSRDFLNWLTHEADEWERKESQNDGEALLRTLELDGYRYRDKELCAPETDVLDAREQLGVLEGLYRELRLLEKETAFHHLHLSEEHFLSARWDDSIANSRKFLECVLRESARAHNKRAHSGDSPKPAYERPVAVRDYLRQEGLLETKEVKAVAEIYGLLSATGGHPYMAGKDQARLLRHLALTLSQFVMLRLQGALDAVSNT